MDAQIVLTGFSDRERASADLCQARQEALERPQRYRVMHVPTRQPADVVMSRWCSEWLCNYWSSGAYARQASNCFADIGNEAPICFR